MNYNENIQNNVNAIFDAVIEKRKNFLKERYNDKNIRSKQFALLDLIKVVNLYFYCIMFGSSNTNKELRTDKLLYLHGINIFFDQIFCDFTKVKYAPTFLTRDVGKIHTLVKFCGEIGELERVKDYYKYHLIEYTGKLENCLQFRFTYKYIGLENFEILEHIVHAEKMLEKQSSIMDEIHENRDIVISQMKKFVYPWQQYFIGYDTNEIIDIYYFRIAKLYSERMFHFECFSDNVEFGGISYSIYKRCAILIISFALKHIQYSQLLKQKSKDINLVDILTINKDIDEMVDVFTNACEISINDARQVLDCFILTHEKYDYHRKNMDYLIMPYIAVSKTQIVFSVVGALSGIYTFLLSELNRKFPKDWSKNISERESLFRKDIFKLFNDELYIKIDRNLPIQFNGKILTDIDACIIEKATNQIVFFQLKWQEQYGHNIGRRQSRMQNFLKETNKWIDDINEWLSNLEKRKLASMLGLKEKQIDINSIKLFVVGRYSVYFSGDFKQDSRSEWALWLQLLRLYNEDCTTFKSLKLLFEKLKEDSPYNKLPKQKEECITTEELDVAIFPLDNV